MTTTAQTRDASFRLRRAYSTDEEFLRLLYAQQRSEELEWSGIDALQSERLIELQFRARQLSYAAQHPEAADQIVVSECETPIGRLLVERNADVTCLVDIALLRDWRGRGIGTRLIQTLQEECGADGVELKLHVVKASTVERLYRRLGFVVTGEDPFRLQMVWAQHLQRAQHDMVPNRQLC